MEQTIRKLIELDAATEARLQAAKLHRREQIQTARSQADAIAQAQTHQIRDTIQEYEEKTRIETERETASLQAEYDAQSAAMTEAFRRQHDTLLAALFDDTLRSAAQ